MTQEFFAEIRNALPQQQVTRRCLLSVMLLATFITLLMFVALVLRLLVAFHILPETVVLPPYTVTGMIAALALAAMGAFFHSLARIKFQWVMTWVIALAGIPTLLGLYDLILIVINNDFLTAKTQLAVPVLAVVNRSIIGLTILGLLWDANRRRTVGLIAGLSGIFLIDLNLFGVVGHIQSIPFLYDFKVSLFSSICYCLFGAMFLVGTLPFPGLLAPLFSLKRHFRLLAFVSLFVGFLLIIAGVATIVRFHNELATYLPDPNALRRWYWQFSLPNVCLSVLISGLSLELLNAYHAREKASDALVLSNQELESRVDERTMALQENQRSLEAANWELKKLTLRLSEKTRLQEYALEGIAQFDTEGYAIDVNAAYAGMIGYTPNDLLGGRWLEVVSPEEKARMEVLYKQMMALGKVQAEVKMIQKDGASQFQEMVLVANRDEGGNFLGHFGFTKDITERKKLEEELKNTILRIHEMERLFSLTSDMICIVDFKGRFYVVNPAFEKTLGYTREELEGQRFVDFIHPDDREKTSAEFQNILYGDSSEYFENRYRCKNGEYRWLLWTSSPDVPAGRVYAVGRDYTDRKNTEHELKKSLDRLMESERQRSTYISALTHDLRTPLIAQRHGLSMLAEMMPEQEDEEFNTLASGLFKNNDNLLELVNRLLESYQYEDSKIPFTFEPVSILSILEDVMEEMRHLVAQKKARLVLKVPESLPQVLADRYHLKRVFQNLLANAIEHLPAESGEVLVEANVEDERLHIVVSDNGTGIDPEIISALFERYLMGVNKRRKIGSGLGLYICRLIIERHGGTIIAENPVEGGARFTLTLPKSPFEESVDVEPTIEPIERHYC